MSAMIAAMNAVNESSSTGGGASPQPPPYRTVNYNSSGNAGDIEMNETSSRPRRSLTTIGIREKSDRYITAL